MKREHLAKRWRNKPEWLVRAYAWLILPAAPLVCAAMAIHELRHDIARAVREVWDLAWRGYDA